VKSDLLDSPKGITFGPDGSLYVVSSMANEILKIPVTYTGQSIVEKFVTDASFALYQPKHIELFNGKICVSSYLTDDIFCYDEDTGNSLGKLTVSFDRALISRENSIVGPDGEIYVSDNLRNEVLRYDGVTGLFADVVISTENDQLHSISYLTFGPDDNLYVSSNDKIFRFNGHNGDFIDIFASQNTSGISNSQGLSFNKDYLYVSSSDNNRVLRYDSENGMFIDEFIKSRDHELLRPTGNMLDRDGSLYVASQGTNKILQYDAETGSFLNDIQLQNSPNGLTLGDDGIFYISMFDTNEVLSYDPNSEQFTLLLSGLDGLNGPEGLAFDDVNQILYVSSSMNDKIIAYDVMQDLASDVMISSGDGILQKPRGLTMKDGILFVSNNSNNEILKYIPQTNVLENFIQDTGDLIRPGGITFGPNSNLYMVNENDNRVYQYDIELGQLLSVFT
jgi:sugar lactone lactonase YvrE